MGSRPLTDTALRNFKPAQTPYKRSDGGGLYIHVTPQGGKLWRMAYRFHGKQKLLSFGKYPFVSLADARARRDQAKRELSNGIDPSALRKEKKGDAHMAAEDAAPAFEPWEAVCKEWLAKRRREGASQATMTKLLWLLEKTFERLGQRDPSTISASDLLSVLKGIEATGSYESALRLRSVCGQVLRYAIATGRAERDVATDLRDALTAPKRKHHPAILEKGQVGRLVRSIHGYDGDPSTKAGLLLLAYTFLRSGEARHAEWEDVNWSEGQLVIPADRMKMRRPHIVPLSKQAIGVLEGIHPITGSHKFILASLRAKGRPISENTMNVALQRLGYTREAMVPHGFRTIASTHLNENGFNRDWIERQLAHVEGNKVRAAYNAAEYLPERTKMMQWYADFLTDLAFPVT